MYIYSNALYNTLLGTFAGLLDGAVHNLNLTSRIHRCPQNRMGVVKNLQVHEMLSETFKYMKLYKTSSSLYQKQSVKKSLCFYVIFNQKVIPTWAPSTFSPGASNWGHRGHKDTKEKWREDRNLTSNILVIFTFIFSRSLWQGSRHWNTWCHWSSRNLKNPHKEHEVGRWCWPWTGAAHCI